MNKFLFDVYRRDGQPHQVRVLSIFPLAVLVGEDEPEADALIAKYLASLAPVDEIHIVGITARIKFLRDAISNDSLIGQRLKRILRSAANDLQRRIKFITFEAATQRYVGFSAAGAPVLSDDISAERGSFLRDIFTSSGGEERAPAGVHFCKTSESHSDRFLRVSRAFEAAGHVELAAFWLVRHICVVRPTQIVVDTSSIYSVALLASQLARRESAGIAEPLIWSHSSHSGVSALPKDALRHGLFLISASTTGGLANRLIQAGVSSERIVTLFGLFPGGSITQGGLLSDLSRSEFGGLDPILSFSARDCPQCKSGSQLIRIDGDQFSLSPPETGSILITTRDLEPKAKAILSALAGKGAFRLYRRDPTEPDQVRDFWVDAVSAIAAPVTAKAKLLQQRLDAWNHYASIAMTHDVTTVVASDYTGSDSLANASLGRFAAALADKVRGVEVGSLDQLRPEPGKSSVIVAAAIDREDELVTISRSLRSFQPNGAAHYLAFMSLFQSSKDREAFISSITYGTHGRQTFRFDAAFELDVNVSKDGASWKRELDLLRKLRRWADRHSYGVPDAVEERISSLESGTARGLTHDALWKSPIGRQLSLQSDFTLLDWSLEAPAVQIPDLYVLWRVILSGLRQQTGSRKLTQNPYQRNVLAPRNFDRYSDGVLQACLLRAAQPSELDYANAGANYSAQMTKLLLDIVGMGIDSVRAEALNEFLIALNAGSLSLRPQELDSVAGSILDRSDQSTHAATHFLATALRERDVWR